MQKDSVEFVMIVEQDQSFGPWMLAKKTFKKKRGIMFLITGNRRIFPPRCLLMRQKKGGNPEGLRFALIEYEKTEVVAPKEE